MPDASTKLTPLTPSPHPGPLSAASLRPLLEAYDRAGRSGRDRWELAVAAGSLRAAGLTDGQLGWLLREGYVAQGVKQVRPDGRPAFRRLGGLGPRDGAYFVLTEAGAACARHGLLSAGEPPTGKVGGPTWDRGRRELRLGWAVVKRFKQPAASQELILEAFEEQGWPTRIDDPLPPRAGQDAKRRLHSAISNLNRCQQRRLIQFEGGGDGQSIGWHLLTEGEDRARTERGQSECSGGAVGRA